MTTEGCEALEALGRTRLSRNFFMRDFLYSGERVRRAKFSRPPGRRDRGG